ncbi:M56 family metallopeptidase [Pedobacter aquatilis]|uniref:M56 family metallopeptidase n=1 Tax=Pedobacter aquatilis TaxID=351343 RepID=UPI00292D9436|nr:M56 family metallopeptidase [Pedobacter aquatilis]
MSWLYYLLEANLYLVLFYGFYRLFLYKETFYVLNRYYLILSTLTAFTIPFMQLGFLTKEIIYDNLPIYQQIQEEKPLLSTENILIFLYLLITIIFLSKICWGFRHIFKLLGRPNKIVENGITIVELRHSKIAFSFFNLLFIDPELPQRNTILNHEMAHIRQKHSFDVLFFELLRSFCWFNPIAHLLKNDIKLLHEYLADEETTNKGIAKYEYALFLIQNSCGGHETALTNQIFNSSILKRRISMLNQKKTAKWARLRLLLVLPVVGGMLCTSTMAFTKDYGIVDLYPKQEKVKEIVIQEPVVKNKAAKKALPAPPPPPAAPPKLKLQKVAPPPPPIEPAPAKKAKKKIAPPPPPIEPKPAKAKEIVIEEPLANPVPNRKKYDKDDVIYGDPTPENKKTSTNGRILGELVKDGVINGVILKGTK